MGGGDVALGIDMIEGEDAGDLDGFRAVKEGQTVKLTSEAVFARAMLTTPVPRTMPTPYPSSAPPPYKTPSLSTPPSSHTPAQP